jgi:hypothetical protein
MSSFFLKSFWHSLYVLTIWVCNFLPQDFGTKAAHKMLVKLTPGGCMGPSYVWQVLFSEKHKIAKKTTAEAHGKIITNLESLEF